MAAAADTRASHRVADVAAAPTAAPMSQIRDTKEVTRWLGVTQDSQLSLNEHHAVRMESCKNAMTQLRRLTGQMGAFASQRQDGLDSMCLVGRYIRGRAMVEWKACGRCHWPGE